MIFMESRSNIAWYIDHYLISGSNHLVEHFHYLNAKCIALYYSAGLYTT
jgi:hypothetical protein